MQKLEIIQINKIVESFKVNPLSKTLSLIESSKSKYPDLNKFSIYHNLYGIINLRISKYNESILNFKQAIKINKDFAEAYLNLGIAYFEKGELDLSHINFVKAFEIRKDYKKAQDAIIEVLSYYEPEVSISIFDKLNHKLKAVPINLDDIKNLTEQKILKFYENCKKIVNKDLSDLSYKTNEIFMRKSKFLNCKRHKALFNKKNIISKFCFSCFKVVIETKNALDLVKLTFIFQRSDYLKFFLRKTMLDNRENRVSFKGFIYCSSVNEVIQVEKKINQELNSLLVEPISINSKRGCSEFSIPYPEYQKINQDHTLNFNYQPEWKSIEKNFDEINLTNERTEKKVNDTLLETSLHNFLVINKWLEVK